jgi:hypothetical protein
MPLSTILLMSTKWSTSAQAVSAWWMTSCSPATPAILLPRTATLKNRSAFAQTYSAIQTRTAELIEKRLLEAEPVPPRKKLTATE